MKQRVLKHFLQAKDFKNKLKQSFQPIEELKDLLSDEEDENQEEYETENAMVTINSLTTEEISRKKNFIGIRRVKADTSESEEEPEQKPDANSIPGMEMGPVKAVKKVPDAADKRIQKIAEKIKSEKDIKKYIKRQSKQSIKKSKAFQTRDKLNNKKNVKLSQRKKNVKDKFLKKRGKLPAKH